MTSAKVLDGLYAKQREAATHVDGPLLINAGPGSGKTHTLVRRTLRIIEEKLARPNEFRDNVAVMDLSAALRILARLITW